MKRRAVLANRPSQNSVLVPPLFGVCRDCLLDLHLDGLQVEAGTLLHRRILNRRLGNPANFLLYKLEAPELKGKPVVECQRTVGTVGKAHAFKWIKANIGQDRPIDLDRATKADAVKTALASRHVKE